MAICFTKIELKLGCHWWGSAPQALFWQLPWTRDWIHTLLAKLFVEELQSYYPILSKFCNYVFYTSKRIFGPIYICLVNRREVHRQRTSNRHPAGFDHLGKIIWKRHPKIVQPANGYFNLWHMSRCRLLIWSTFIGCTLTFSTAALGRLTPFENHSHFFMATILFCTKVVRSWLLMLTWPLLWKAPISLKHQEGTFHK